MNAARYEPILVTTLRRYLRRGAPATLLRRLAGGPGDWRVLNQAWELDGKAPPVRPRMPLSEIRLHEGMPRLTQAERRIAIEQIADDCVDTGAMFPSPCELAGFFGCNSQTILNDLRWMRARAHPDAAGRSA